jgi:hypothetical protein
MESIERDLNAYLFREFGMEEEGEETSISETWPFSLRRLGEIGVRIIFEFDDADEPHFAIGGPGLDFLPKNGMTIDDLALQFVGYEWIAAQDPVSLAESRPGDDSIPSGIERLRALRNWEDTRPEIHALRSYQDCFFGTAVGIWDCFAS